MIKKRRLKLKMTQKELSKKIGVSQAYISKIESNEFINITLIEIIKLSKVLNLKESEVVKYFLNKYNHTSIEDGEGVV